MRVIRDNVWLCQDCTQVSCNGPHGLDIPEKTLAETVRGLARLGTHLVPDFDSETGKGIRNYTWLACTSCETTLAGYRARFAVLGDDSQEV